MNDNDNNRERDWRNQRLMDIFTVVAVLALLMAGYRVLAPHFDSPAQTSYIVPSQHVHW
ncbi:MAG: hypothetical protein K2X60_11935 [Xanthobacteraceae bacterium]|nr:hypothetical protein [Xanthobacteraceae bacterium]